MNIIVECNDFSSKHGEVTLNDVMAYELVAKMSCVDVQELLQTIKELKGEDYVLEVIKE